MSPPLCANNTNTKGDGFPGYNFLKIIVLCFNTVDQLINA
jgi:hypothetical protein